MMINEKSSEVHVTADGTMFKPTGHHILVEPDKVDEKKGRLFVPIETQERQQNEMVTGKVLAVGANAWKGFDDGQPWAAVGDSVYFAKYGGYEILKDDQRIRLLNDEDVSMVTEAPPKREETKSVG